MTDSGTGKIGKVTTAGSITEYALLSGMKPRGITIGPNKNLWFTSYEAIGSITTAGAQSEPVKLAANSDPLAITTGADNNLWFTEFGPSYIGKLNITPIEGEQRKPEPGMTVEYNVPLSGTSLPNMTSSEVEKWAQTDDPTEATAVFPPDEPQTWPASSYKRATIYYRDGTGRTVNVAAPNGAISTSEYNGHNDVIRTLSANNRAVALKEAKPSEVAKLLDTQSTYNTEGTELFSTLGPRHFVKLTNGKEVYARAHTVYEYDLGAPTEGGPYRLVTKTTQGAQTETEGEQDVRTVTTSYSGQGNLGWKLRKPTSVVTDPTGLKITHTTLYDETTGNVIETRMPRSAGAESPHDSKTIYYTASANSSYPSCGEHPEWATLACETLPGKQPNVVGVPNLPVERVTAYNMYGEPLTSTSTVTVCVKVAAGKGKYTNSNCTTTGTGEYEIQESTRTKTLTYDEAGRQATNEMTATAGKTLPKVTDKYSETTGALIEQATSSTSLKSAYNKLGELTSYTDASGKTTTYEYEGEGSYKGEKEKDGRLRHESNAEGTETFAYNETTGLLSEATISGVGTFTAGYDLDGNMTTETYPNGMTAAYTYNHADEASGLVYKKETNCTEGCEWFKDSVTHSIHAQWSVQASSLGKYTYTYDAAGRLTEATQTPAGKGCVTRRYTYDEDTNRTSVTTYAPNSKNECATESSTIEKHAYDEADRLTDTGVAYEPFGETAKLPANDAGGQELSSSFYVDGQLASQEQNGQTIGYSLDPAGRTSEVISTGKIVATETQHYTEPGNTVAWTSEPSGNTTRDITAMNGLVARQYNTEKPVLQLTNLHGDIIATAEDSETATKLASTIAEPTEYGVPGTEAPPKYSWLGAHETPTELPSGIQAMGARSYVPQLGRFLQPDPLPGGSANAYTYTNGDPVNSYDLTGEYTATIDAFDEQYVGGRAAQAAAVRAAEIRAAEEAAARAEAEQKAAEAAAQANLYAAMESESPEEEWGEEEWYEVEGEEWGLEDAAFGPSPGNPHQEAHLEDGVLYQALQEEANGLRASPAVSTLAVLCHRELQSAGVGKQHGVCARLIDLCHSKFGGCGRLVKEGKLRSGRRTSPACARIHDCPFPEPSNWTPVKYAVRKVIQAGKVILEWVLLE
jgi:RHS repeat-associated protein